MKFIAEFAKKKEEDSKNVAKGIAYLGGTGLIGQQTIRSGVPRALGVRLESHSTSKKNAKAILKEGGVLDPNYGGTGASKSINNTDFIAESKNKVHITGKHENHKITTGKTTVRDLDGKLISSKNTYKKLEKNILRDILYRKYQRGMYRGVTGENINVTEPGGIKKALSNIVSGLTGTKGKTLYLGGSDDYFNKNFTPDTDDIALKTGNKIKVHSNRAGAVLEALKREGGGNRLKGLVDLIKSNPKRALVGAGILTSGGMLTTKLGQGAYNNLAPGDGKVKNHLRRSKSGKLSNVKSFVRDKSKK